MRPEFIDKLFSQVSYISDLTFTGGEPSLYPEIIEYALESAKRHKVSVGNFFIVTNGKKITEEFAVACLKWYAYCDDNEMTGVEVSNDDYHDKERSYGLLQGLSFFSERKYAYSDSIIAEGKARNWGVDHKTVRESISVWEHDDGTFTINDGIVYLNCKGKLVAGCDWSYANQNRQEICKVGELTLEALEDFGADIEYSENYVDHLQEVEGLKKVSHLL
jgi:hypothetical protein